MRQRQLQTQQQAQLQKQRQAQLEQQRREQRIRSMLDHDCVDLLRRAEAAEKVILTSDVRAQNLLDPPVDEGLLRENVRAVLNAGIKITNVRAKQREITGKSSLKSEQLDLGDIFGGGGPGLGDLFGGLFSRGGSRDPQAKPTEGMPGPLTAAVLGPQYEALGMALRSVESRVVNLEHYASSVRMVDATYRDLIGATEAERLNDSVRDVLAETVRDELAAEELRALTERATAAEQAFRDSIQEANLAGEILALPGERKA